MFESTQIIGDQQFQHAMDSELEPIFKEIISGAIDYRHAYVKMKVKCDHINRTSTELCSPAMGYAFAAGPPMDRSVSLLFPIIHPFNTHFCS